ncbi:hypothetical protein RI367_004623 [Sorochytrium milnesiophthora]
MMQDMSFYFAKSAIATNDIAMERLYALEQLPLLQELCEEDGVTLSRWLLDLYAFNYDPIMYARGGHLGMLQLIRGDVCSQCIALIAGEAGELHIVAWCRYQDWPPCAEHSIQA